MSVEPLTLDGSNETTDFLAVEQQLARALRLMIGVAATLVRRDVHVDEENLTVADDAVRVADVCSAVAERLHLGAGEHDARLPAVEDLVVEPRALVARDRDLVGRSLGILGHR